MDPTYARYPFLSAARAAVRETGADLATLVAEGDPAVERGRERVERGLLDGTVESERNPSPREELLSYPLARILVSLLDADAAIEKYATAEAATAYERFTEDFEVEDGRAGRIDRPRLLREFGLASRVTPEPLPAHRRSPGRDPQPEWFRVAVGSYLSLADPEWGDDWRLVNREVADGVVRVEREELYRLLRAAVRRRVLEGLPFDRVAEELAADLERQLTDLQELLADRTTETTSDVVAPELFPPCVSGLLESARAGERLDRTERFALVSFLAALGCSTVDVVALTGGGLSAETADEALAVLADGDGAQYPPPSCRTLASYDICHNDDDHRAVAPHPLDYYERQLAAADDVTDWRDRTNAD